MKIVIFSDVFLPKLDGVVMSAEQLILELDRLGHHVLVVAPKAKGVPTSMGKRVEFYYLPSIPSGIYPQIYAGFPSIGLGKALKKLDPEVFVLATPILVGHLGVFWAKKLKKPSIGVFHTYVMKPEYLQLVGLKPVARYVESPVWTIMRWFYDSCTMIISPSKLVKDDLLEHKFSRPIEICHNGIKVDTKLTSEVSKELKKIAEKKQIDPRKVIMYVGRISKEKNLEMLLRVFQLVSLKEPAARLLIIGAGPILDDLKRYAAELNIDKQVIFWGQIDHDELLAKQLFRLARVFCTCSTSEVQPMSMIEGMLFGVPMIVPAVPAMLDLIKGNGFTINPPESEEQFSEKIVELLADDDLHQKFSLASERDSLRFSLEETVQQYLKVFSQAIKLHETLQ